MACSTRVFCVRLRQARQQEQSAKPDSKSNKPDSKSNKPDSKSNKPDSKRKKPNSKTNKPDSKSTKPDSKSNRRNHERASRRQAFHRPADPAPAPGKTGIARAFVRTTAADVGCVQARHRQGNHAGRDHDGRAARSDRLVRRAG